MATIYDVAKKASVSISTVSNFLNNKYVGPEKREAISKAIADLGYVPNPSAKRLKTKKSNQVAIVLPNIDEKIYCEILSSIHLALSKKDYRAILYCSCDTPEKKILAECMTSNYAGLIICTNNSENNTDFIKLQKTMPVVFILRKPRLKSCNFISFNEKKTIYNIAKFFLSNGHENMALLTQDFPDKVLCAKGYSEAFLEYSKTPNIISLPKSKSEMFKQAMHILSQPKPIKLIITTSSEIAHAFLEAAELRKISLNADVNIVSLGEDSWYNTDIQNPIIKTAKPAKRLGMIASETLIANIANKKSFEYVIKSLDDEFMYSKLKKVDENLKRFTSISVKPFYAKTIKLLLRENDNMSDAIKYVLPHFSDKEKIKVDVKTLPQTEIYKHIINKQKISEYDLVAIDVPWLSQLSQNNCLLDISNQFNMNSLYSAFSKDTIDQFSTHNGKLYCIPYLNATQLLYYRKDWFKNRQFKQDYYATYGKKLEVPKTWFDYNLIAKFFTKRHNTNSPCEFGTSVVMSFHEGLMGELYPRIWAYGGCVFDEKGNISVYSEQNIQAFKNIIKSISYSDKSLYMQSGLEKVKNFANGKTALIVAYHHYAEILSEINDCEQSEKFGYDFIPSNMPVLAGWSMGINNYSKNKNESIKFLNWLIDIQSSISYSVLSGSIARQSTYYNPDILKIYPWLDHVPASSKNAIARNTPLVDGKIVVSEAYVEKVLANVVFSYLKKEGSLETLLQNAHNTIKDKFIENGYIEPSIF